MHSHLQIQASRRATLLKKEKQSQSFWSREASKASVCASIRCQFDFYILQRRKEESKRMHTTVCQSLCRVHQCIKVVKCVRVCVCVCNLTRYILYVLYVCMYVRTYARMYVCIYVSMYLCIYLSIYLSIYVSMYVCMILYDYV